MHCGDTQQSKEIPGHNKFSQYYLQRNGDPFQANFKIYIKYLTRYFHTSVVAKQHKPISTEVLFRWCVSTPQQDSIDIRLFGSHSTRSVSTLHCQRKCFSITRPQDGLPGFIANP